MALAVATPEDVPHSGIFLEFKARESTEAMWSSHWGAHTTESMGPGLAKHYEAWQDGGKTSTSDRTVCMYILSNPSEGMKFGCKTSTTVDEVIDMIANFTWVDPDQIKIKRKTLTGFKEQKPFEEVNSTIFVHGISSFRRPIKQYEHPILVVGAGLGAIQAMINMQEKGRTDIICIDKCHDFGGTSWIDVPNKYTKLQTERGTYHVDYIKPEAPVPRKFGAVTYPTWPTRDILLHMMRTGAREHGFYDYAIFNSAVAKVTKKGDHYMCPYVPTVEDEDAEGGLLITSVVYAWPGFLHQINVVDWSGEDDFDGYIDYSSFDRIDYTQCTDKVCCLYGHGAFAIENVRTLCEFRVKKIWCLCRRRNLAGTKVASWAVGAVQRPLNALCLLEAFQKMYDLAGFDTWTAHSVTVDEKRTSCTIQQKTIFGVTDIYFLACYFRLCEVLVDDVRILSYHCVHTKKKQKVKCEVIIKATGTGPSFKVDKELSIKEILGLWVNGDPRRPIQMGVKGVLAKNFGSFSVGPGYAPAVKDLSWFIDYPDDFEWIRDELPVRKADEYPCYVVGPSYGMSIGMLIAKTFPLLAMQEGEAGALKPRKQWESHPWDEYLAECKMEWEQYIVHFRKHDLVRGDMPDPPYPYDQDFARQLHIKNEKVAAGERPDFFTPGLPDV